VPLQSERRLYEPAELPFVLKLSQEQIDWLINTDQLHPIRIAGEIRFESRELDRLINTYLQIATRKASYVQ
jgi:hypothetical protein